MIPGFDREHLRLICARVGDTRVKYDEGQLPMVRTCDQCGQKVLATKQGLERMGPRGNFTICCLECHARDPGEKLVFNQSGKLLYHVPARRQERHPMHDKPVDDHKDGTFRDEWRVAPITNPRFQCQCGSKRILYRIWESNDGAYEDTKYQCLECGHIWWVESDDG